MMTTVVILGTLNLTVSEIIWFLGWHTPCIAPGHADRNCSA